MNNQNQVGDRVLFLHDNIINDKLANQIDSLSVSVSRAAIDQFDSKNLIETEVLVIVDPTIEMLNRIASINYLNNNDVEIVLACQNPSHSLIAYSINVLHANSIYDYVTSSDLTRTIEDALISLTKKVAMKAFAGGL